jgi:hypothetical protein
MSELDDDIARGYLPNGEPLEARWGTSWWTERNSEDQIPDITECPKCHGAAYDLMADGIDCENCGKLSVDDLKPYYEKKGLP